MEDKKIYRLGDIEEVITEMDFSDCDDDIAEIDTEFQIWISGWKVVIPSLGISVRVGVACAWYEEENMFMPDFSVTVLYEGEADTGSWLYYEQDGFLITLANWLNGRMPINAIEKLECYIEIADVTN